MFLKKTQTKQLVVTDDPTREQLNKDSLKKEKEKEREKISLPKKEKDCLVDSIIETFNAQVDLSPSFEEVKKVNPSCAETRRILKNFLATAEKKSFFGQSFSASGEKMRSEINPESALEMIGYYLCVRAFELLRPDEDPKFRKTFRIKTLFREDYWKKHFYTSREDLFDRKKPTEESFNERFAKGFFYTFFHLEKEKQKDFFAWSKNSLTEEKAFSLFEDFDFENPKYRSLKPYFN